MTWQRFAWWRPGATVLSSALTEQENSPIGRATLLRQSYGEKGSRESIAAPGRRTQQEDSQIHPKTSLRAWRVTCLLILGLVWLVIGVDKLRHFEAFVDLLDGYRVFPEKWLEPAAGLIVGTEIVLAAGLCLPRFQRGSALGLIFLLLIFTTAITSSLLHGLNIDCGCFGTLSGPMKISWWMVGRNLAIIAGLGLTLVYADPNRPEKLPHAIRTWLAALAAIGILGASLVWFMQDDQILSNKLTLLDPALRLKAGDLAPRVTVEPVGGGREEELNLSGNRQTILLIFSPTCPHCQEAIQWWNHRLPSLNLRPNPPRLIGISLSREIKPEFLKNFPVSFPVYIPGSLRKFTQAYNAPYVPLTIFINPEGKITYITQGFPPKMLE